MGVQKMPLEKCDALFFILRYEGFLTVALEEIS